MATIKAINPVTKQTFDVNEAEFNSGVYKGWTRADATPTTPPPTNLQKLSVGMANGSITNQSQVPIDTTIKTSDLKPENIINNASIVNKAKVEATTLTPDQLKGLDSASARIANGTANATDIANVNYAKSKKGYVYTAPTVNNQNLAQNGSNISGNTQVEQPVIKSALDQKMDIANNYRANKAAETAKAKEEYGVADIQKRQIEIQTKADEILAKIEKSQTDQNAEDILNEEAKIALKNKIEGQPISMTHINRQLLRGLEDLNQAQRLDRLYDTYELNTQINQYNALNRNAQLLQGQYTQAMDNVKESVDDWQTEQDLKMQILDEQGSLEKEERAKIESENNYERGLMEEGYVYVESTDTYNKLVKQFGVNAGNFSSFFYKDPTNDKIYLKPGASEMSSVGSVAGGTSKSSTVKSSGGKATGGYTAQEQRKLRAEGIDPTDIEAADAFLYKKTTTGSTKLTKSQQDELSQMETVSNIVDQILDYNADGKLEGIGSFGLGTLKSWFAQAGMSSQEGMTVRALIGNIKGTIAKLRGGTSFTPNEEKLLDSYTPSINDNPKVALNKLNLLKDFIALKKGNLYKFVGGTDQTENSTKAEDLRTKYNY